MIDIEAYLDIRQIFVEELELLKNIAENHKFRVLELPLKVNEGEYQKYSIIVAGQDVDLENLKTRVKSIVDDLHKSKYKVLRYKIFGTLVDSRSSDVLRLL